MTERVRRSLQTVTDLGQFTRRKIDALLLCIRTRVLAVSFLDKALQLHRHVLDSMGEVGELSRDERHVRVLSHVVWRILGRGEGLRRFRDIVASLSRFLAIGPGGQLSDKKICARRSRVGSVV